MYSSVKLKHYTVKINILLRMKKGRLMNIVVKTNKL